MAIKVILPQYANQPDFIRRFETEAQLVAQLEHLHIVPLYDFWRDPDGAYLVMRLMKGGSLEDSINTGDRMEISDIARLLDQVTSALNAAHKKGIVHRDLKPANILLDEDGNAYLTDFGIAKAIGTDIGMTATGAIMGTPAYISPEQVQSLPISPQTDIYSLGVVLYQLLTGEHPFPNTSLGTLIIKHTHEPLPLVQEKRQDLSRDVDEVIQKSTSKFPGERYSDTLIMAREFCGALKLERMIIEVGKGELINPYKGLHAFQEADAEDFFGRQALINKLITCLKHEGEFSRFLAVLGPSGSGKSSVVKAGLLPVLRQGALPGSQQWFIIDMLPRAHPIEELDINLSRISANPNVNVSQQLSRDERGLLRCARMILPKEDGELLIIIDQFEELFTLVEDKNEASHFMDLIYSSVTDSHSQVNVIITLRADFYDRPLMYPDFSNLLKERTSLVIPLSTRELEDAIRTPAEQAGVVLEKSLVPAVITDVLNQPGALPLLQYALTELFELRDGRRLTHQAYGSIGGVLGALGRRAEAVYTDLVDDEKDTARQMFLRLVTLGEGVEDTRRRVLRSELESLPAVSLPKVIGLFGQARLLSFDRDPNTRDSTIEVAHEALLKEWHRLKTWLDESRTDLRIQRILTRSAKEWLSEDQDPSFMLRGSRLAQFEDWFAVSTITLTTDERVYLAACLEARQAREKEEDERHLRELEQISIGLAGQALHEIDGPYPDRAVPLALESLEEYPYTWQAHRALGEAVLNHRLNFVLSHGGFVNSLELSQNGNLLLTGSNDGSVRIWRTSDGTGILSMSDGNPVIAKWSKDESSILTIGGDRSSIRVWNSVTSSLRHSHIGDAEINYTPFNWFPWSPQGDRYVTAHNGGATIWDAISGNPLSFLSTHRGVISDAAWSPSGEYIVTTGKDNTAILWDANIAQELFTLPGVDGDVKFGSWSTNGDRFALRGLNRVSIFETNSGEELLRIPLLGLWTNFTRFSPDGTKIITTIYQDGTARLYDVKTGQLLSILSGLTQGLGVSWSPDANLASVVGVDGSIRIWNTATGVEVQKLPFFGANYCVWSPQGDKIYAAGRDSNDIKMFKLSSASITLTGIPGIVGFGDWSPDGQQFGRGFIDGPVKVWSAASGKEVFDLNTGAGGGGFGPCLKWSPSGDRILTWNDDGTLCVWNASSGDLIRDFIGHEGGIFYGDWSPDGSQIITSGTSVGEVTVWDTATGEQIWQIAPPNGSYSFAKWSPDGKKIISTGSHGQGTIRDAPPARRF